jgi:uroporphyrin-III C-methyltransferase/precorrin-2 dehydrogenase/sirohydrochlorin ferrochelatase
MRFLPVFLDVTSGAVVLVGSGEQALSKLRLLRAAHAVVRWYPGRADGGDAIAHAVPATGRVEMDSGDPLTASLAGVIAVVSASGDERDERMAARAREAGIPVNVVDRPASHFRPSSTAAR